MSILKLTDICKDYIQGKEPVRVLKNVCLEVEQGDYIAIMGPALTAAASRFSLCCAA